MFCNNCGTEISEGTNTCPACGTVVEEVCDATITDNKSGKKNTNTISIILCIVGSIAALFIPLIGYACGGGCIGNGIKQKKDGENGTLSIVLGVVCLVVSLASNIIGQVLLNSAK